MTIEGVASYEEIYSENLTNEDIKRFNRFGVEWRGRNILDIRDDFCIKAIGVFALIYAQKAFTNSKELPQLKAEIVQIFEDLFDSEVEDEDEPSPLLYRYDPISDTYRELIGAEAKYLKKTCKKVGKGFKKAKKAVAKGVRETGRWVREHPIETAVIVVGVVVGGAGVVAAVGGAVEGAARSDDNHNKDKPTTSRTPANSSSDTHTSPSTSTTNNPTPTPFEPFNPIPSINPSTSLAPYTPSSPQFQNLFSNMPQHLYELSSEHGSNTHFNHTPLVPPSSLINEYKTYSTPASPFAITPISQSLPPKIPSLSYGSSAEFPSTPRFVYQMPSSSITQYPGIAQAHFSWEEHKKANKSPIFSPHHFKNSQIHYQEIQSLGQAIEADPSNPVLYLERGIAYFGSGQYDHSIEDYKMYISQTQKPQPYLDSEFSLTEFSLGFAKGLPQGVYESGKGMLLFMADFVTHPINTSKQIVDSVSTLVNLVRSDEFGMVAEALAPEVKQLVTQWDTLPSNTRGELAGYAVGKHGTDILLPGALAKVASRSVKSAEELVAICKNIQRAQETLVLETAAGIGNSAKVAELIQTGQKTTFLGKQLGFTSREMAQLKQAGKLEGTIAHTYENVVKVPAMRESIILFEKAGEKLKPHQGVYMSESQVRELIQATGIPTFARPKGIPENYRIKLSDKPGGIKFVHPVDEGTYVRIMPGKPHSKNPRQQRPYVNQRINGKSVDKHGNMVLNKSEEAHIPLEEFVYKKAGKINYD